MLSIIIPTLNEEEGIAKVICSIPEEIRKISEVIVVDVSDDMTPRIARALGAKVIRPPKKGKGYQMRQAVYESKGDIIVFLDGDGTDPAEYIPALLVKLEKANLVLGRRSLEEFGGEIKIRRQVLQMLYNAIAYPVSYIIGFNSPDPLAGFRAIRRKDWDSLDLKSNNFEIEMEMNINAVKKHFIIDEVLIPKLKRCGGVGGSKFLKSPKMWFKVLKMVLDYKLERYKNNK